MPKLPNRVSIGSRAASAIAVAMLGALLAWRLLPVSWTWACSVCLVATIACVGILLSEHLPIWEVASGTGGGGFAGVHNGSSPHWVFTRLAHQLERTEHDIKTLREEPATVDEGAASVMQTRARELRKQASMLEKLAAIAFFVPHYAACLTAAMVMLATVKSEAVDRLWPWGATHLTWIIPAIVLMFTIVERLERSVRRRRQAAVDCLDALEELDTSDELFVEALGHVRANREAQDLCAVVDARGERLRRFHVEAMRQMTARARSIQRREALAQACRGDAQPVPPIQVRGLPA